MTAVGQQAPSAPPPNADSTWQYGQNDQWDQSWDQRGNPDAGACFYTESSYSGHHFCVRVGDRLPELPSHFGHHITSVQLFGGSRVRLFNDSNYKNGSVIIDHSIDNLRDVPFRGGHTWNDRIGSIVVFEGHGHDHDNDSGGL